MPSSQLRSKWTNNDIEWGRNIHPHQYGSTDLFPVIEKENALLMVIRSVIAHHSSGGQN